MTSDSSRLRTSIVGVVVLALFSALFARLWYLQVAAGDSYAVAAQQNSVRIVQTEAPRGRILDAQGRVLVDNRIANVITMDRNLDDEDRDVVVARLAELLEVEGAVIEERLNDARVSPYTPVPVAVDVPFEVLAHVTEHQDDFPGVEAQAAPLRSYPNGPVAAHVLGYTGEINEEELAARDGQGYELGETIGKAGIEQTFEADLRGAPALEKIEVDAEGRPLGILGTQEAEPGNDVRLTVDLDVQRVAEESLAQGLEAAREERDRGYTEGFRTFAAPAGAVVVLDVNTGAVVAMASNPTYDPSQFVDGIPTELWEALNEPANHYPLNNRAIQGQYAPGSTFKLVTALAALESGVISPGTTVNDQGSLRVADRVFRNAGGYEYGRVNLQRALTVSSDVYFYDIGSKMWSAYRRGEASGEAIQGMARALGFGAPSGVALPSEAAGRVPDDDWKVAFNTDNPDPQSRAENSLWLPGDSVNLAVGQGDLLVTPLQLATAYAAFANGGVVVTPRVGTQVVDPQGTLVRDLPPAPRAQVPLPGRDSILAGLEGVITDGTAEDAFAGFPLDEIPIAGKTGTAEVQGKSDTSVFVAFTPVESPRYVVVAVMEESGFGAEAAAPVVRRVIEALNRVPLSGGARAAGTGAN